MLSIVQTVWRVRQPYYFWSRPGFCRVEYSIDNGVTWTNSNGSFVSPRCGFPAPTVPTKWQNI
jgi:hypothetical protein